jgi:hypothetical protein
MNMRFVIGAITAGILLFSGFTVSGVMAATPYFPAQPILVVSETITPGSPSGDGTFWHIIPQTDDDGSFYLDFQQTEFEPPVCRLILSGPRTGLYLADGARFPNTVSAADLMLFPGFSIPCDVLGGKEGFCDGKEPAVIDIRRQSGQSIFIEQYQLHCSEIPSSEAATRGWVREPTGEADHFVMVRVTNLRTGENVARQLWAPGETWWRYEDTPFRRSWRLP